MQTVQSVSNIQSPSFANNGGFDRQTIEDFLSSSYLKDADKSKREDDYRIMLEVTNRLRQQLRSIICSVRLWRGRHPAFSDDLRIRYSAYEGALCYSDLRRHWAFYRHAMKELGSMKN